MPVGPRPVVPVLNTGVEVVGVVVPVIGVVVEGVVVVGGVMLLPGVALVVGVVVGVVVVGVMLSSQNRDVSFQANAVT